MQRLGKNHGGYRGQSIDIQAVLQEVLDAAAGRRWQIERLPVRAGLDLLALRRSSGRSRRRLYLSAGIHGDEPAGPLAIRQLLVENPWPDDSEVWLCPCLNPTGFLHNRRENADGLDLNRDYRHFQTAEVQAHVAWLRRQPAFDLTLCLHEDWEAQGFYLYELNPDGLPSLAEPMTKAVADVCPLDRSPVIEGRPAAQGIIRPSLDPNRRLLWPEAFFLILNKTRHSYTLEAPSDFPLATRVAALVVAVRTALRSLAPGA
jgi:hypothetical protein